MEYAFTDRMVREDPRLVDAATKYLLDYSGSFEPLVNAKKRLLEEGELPTPHARLVLNAMRSDTSVKLEYTPPEGKVIQFPNRQAVQGFVFPNPVEEAPKPKYREFLINGQVKERYSHAMSMHKTSQVIHIVDHEATKVTFKQAGTRSYSRGKGWQQIWQDRIEFDLRWVCSKPPAKVRLLTLGEAIRLVDEGLMRICPGCHRMGEQ